MFASSEVSSEEEDIDVDGVGPDEVKVFSNVPENVESEQLVSCSHSAGECRRGKLGCEELCDVKNDITQQAENPSQRPPATGSQHVGHQQPSTSSGFPPPPIPPHDNQIAASGYSQYFVEEYYKRLVLDQVIAMGISPVNALLKFGLSSNYFLNSYYNQAQSLALSNLTRSSNGSNSNVLHKPLSVCTSLNGLIPEGFPNASNGDGAVQSDMIPSGPLSPLCPQELSSASSSGGECVQGGRADIGTVQPQQTHNAPRIPLASTASAAAAHHHIPRAAAVYGNSAGAPPVQESPSHRLAGTVTSILPPSIHHPSGSCSSVAGSSRTSRPRNRRNDIPLVLVPAAVNGLSLQQNGSSSLHLRHHSTSDNRSVSPSLSSHSGQIKRPWLSDNEPLNLGKGISSTVAAPTSQPLPAHVPNIMRAPTKTNSNNNDQHQNRNADSSSERDREYVKKPLNAFMLFMKDNRQQVIERQGMKESALINKELGQMWRSLDQRDQARYYSIAQKEREVHMQRFPDWSARDNYATHKKKKPKVDRRENRTTPQKCRARYGATNREQWCQPCRRKKRCIRFAQQKALKNAAAAAAAAAALYGTASCSNGVVGEDELCDAMSSCDSAIADSPYSSNMDNSSTTGTPEELQQFAGVPPVPMCGVPQQGGVAATSTSSSHHHHHPSVTTAGVSSQSSASPSSLSSAGTGTGSSSCKPKCSPAESAAGSLDLSLPSSTASSSTPGHEEASTAAAPGTVKKEEDAGRPAAEPRNLSAPGPYQSAQRRPPCPASSFSSVPRSSSCSTTQVMSPAIPRQPQSSSTSCGAATSASSAYRGGDFGLNDSIAAAAAVAAAGNHCCTNHVPYYSNLYLESLRQMKQSIVSSHHHRLPPPPPSLHHT